jgi:LacI family transcriptional regulator
MALKRQTHRVTLATVAADADVSTTTASVILSGRPEGLRQFNPDTVDRVRHSAKRLGYHANLFAAGLSQAASPFFALIIHHKMGEQRVTPWHFWAFEGELLGGVIEAATLANLHPIIGATDTEVDPTDLRPFERMIAGGVFGTIARTPPPKLEEYLQFKFRQGCRMVVIFPASLSRWKSNAIDVDNEAIGRTAAQILLAEKRRRCLVVHPDKYGESRRKRVKGFMQVARESGVSVRQIKLAPGINEAGAADVMFEHMKTGWCDAAFGVNCLAAVGSLVGCIRAERQVCEEVSIVGCDASRWPSSSLPGITSVDISWSRMGEMAVEQLRHLSASGEIRFENILVPPQIAPAASCRVSAALVEATEREFEQKFQAIRCG